MAIQISCLVAAHNSLWVGTENGILLTFPFNAPSVVAEETGWEVIKVSIPTFSNLQRNKLGAVTACRVYHTSAYISRV